MGLDVIGGLQGDQTMKMNIQCMISDGVAQRSPRAMSAYCSLKQVRFWPPFLISVFAEHLAGMPGKHTGAWVSAGRERRGRN